MALKTVALTKFYGDTLTVSLSYPYQGVAIPKIGIAAVLVSQYDTEGQMADAAHFARNDANEWVWGFVERAQPRREQTTTESVTVAFPCNPSTPGTYGVIVRIYDPADPNKAYKENVIWRPDGSNAGYLQVVREAFGDIRFGVAGLG